MDEFELWRLPDGLDYGDEIVGFVVEGADGPLGTVIKASAEVGRSYLILAAGPWLGATMVMLPAALIERIDREHETIGVASDRQEISEAPPFAADRFRDSAYRAELGFHYARRRRSLARLSSLVPLPPLAASRTS